MSAHRQDPTGRAAPGPAGIAVTLGHLVALRWRVQRRASAAGGAATPRPGLAQSRRLGRGLDQEDIRAYAAGDDARRIDWRATARLGRMQVKLFREERERLCVLVVDLRPSMAFGTRGALRSTRAAECAALLAWGALDRGERVAGLLLTADGAEWTRPGRGQAAVLGLLGRVAALQQAGLERRREPDPPLAPLLRNLARLGRGGAAVALVSAFETPGEGFGTLLAELAIGASLSAFWVEDPAERGLPPGLYAWSDGARRALARLARSAPEPEPGVERDLRAANIPVIRVPTPSDPAQVLAAATGGRDGR